MRHRAIECAPLQVLGKKPLTDAVIKNISKNASLGLFGRSALVRNFLKKTLRKFSEILYSKLAVSTRPPD